MAYDRQGRKASIHKASINHEQPEQTATPNAARVQGGQTVRGRAPIRRAMGQKASPSREEQHQTGASRELSRRSGTFIRVLPVVVIVCLFLMGVKVVGIWDALENGTLPVSVAAFAEADSPAPKSADVESDAEPQQLAQATEPAKTDHDKPLDPVLFTRSEIELLQDLSKRRKELDAREQAVIQKEGLLTAAENRIDKKIVELQKVRTEIEGLIKTYDEQEEKEIKGLVQIYEKMKPKDAARIFDELDMSILLRVFDRMKASKSSSVLANMRPQKAKEITSRIAERMTIPTTN